MDRDVLRSLRFAFAWVLLLLLSGWLFFFYLPGCGPVQDRNGAMLAPYLPETVVVYKNVYLSGGGYAVKKKGSESNAVFTAGVTDTARGAGLDSGRVLPGAYYYQDSLLSLSLTVLGDSARVDYTINCPEKNAFVSVPALIPDTSALRVSVGSLVGAGTAAVMFQLQSDRVGYLVGVDLYSRRPIFGINVRLHKFEGRRIRNIRRRRLMRGPEAAASGFYYYEKSGSTQYNLYRGDVDLYN